MDQTIAFIGLGHMGGPMCQNLLKSGYRVSAFDLDHEACERIRSSGANIAPSAREASASADIVVTMLPASEHAAAVWSSVTGTLREKALLIDCSTIDVHTARQLHELAAKHKFYSLDAPVSGGVSGAQNATLTFMAGGTPQAFALAESVLRSMGKKVFHCGGPGAGQATKICNNMLLAISMIGVCEALNLGQKLGLDNQVMYDVMTASSGRCWSLDTYCPVPGPLPASPANHRFTPGFATTLMLKDLTLAQAAASAERVSTPLGEKALEIYKAFAAAGGGGLDFSGVINFLRTEAEPA